MTSIMQRPDPVHGLAHLSAIVLSGNLTNMLHINTKRILVPLDFSTTAERALKPAAIMARQSKGELFLLHVCHDTGDLYCKAFRNHQAMIGAIAAGLAADYGIKISTIISNGKCPTEIVRACKENDIGLVIMGTQGADSTSSFWFGSNARRVIAHSQIPVLTLRFTTVKPAFNNILLPIDLSDHSRQKVGIAFQLASLFNAKVYAEAVLDSNDEEHRFKLEVIMQHIRKMADATGIDCRVSISSTKNPVGHIIQRSIACGAGLIITMTDEHAKGVFSNKKFDEQLMNESPVPVLSVQPEIHEENIELATISGLG
jgi:nucleotide-binding universal stress UspA family protein